MEMEITPSDWLPAWMGPCWQIAPEDVALHDQPPWPSLTCSLPPPPLPLPWPAESELPAGSSTDTVTAVVAADPVSLTWKTIVEWWCPPWTSTVALSWTGGDGLAL
jgi:hypothetical protein